MKRFMYGISALALAMAAPTSAQNPTVPSVGYVSEYVVQPGDNLWRLADLRLKNPNLWSWVVEQNPVLEEPGRSFTKADGTFVVVIRPGERLYGLEEVGVNLTSTTAILTPATNVADKEPETGLSDFAADNWWWLALLLAGGAFTAWLLSQLRRDPVESGPAIVPGGVDPGTARQRFEQRAAVQHFTILDQTRGVASGIVMVSYANGTSRPRRLDNTPAYRATVRHQNGRIEELYMLEGCGNDLRFGGIKRYLPGEDFRFMADEPIATPAPEEAPAAMAVEPEPVVEEAVELASPPATDPASREPELKVELKPAEDEEDTSMIRVTGAPTEDMTLTISENGFTLRFHPPKKPA